MNLESSVDPCGENLNSAREIIRETKGQQMKPLSGVLSKELERSSF